MSIPNKIQWKNTFFDSRKTVYNSITRKRISRFGQTCRYLLKHGHIIRGNVLMPSYGRVVTGGATVIDPRTKKPIEVGGVEYLQLINAGYVELPKVGLVLRRAFDSVSLDLTNVDNQYQVLKARLAAFINGKSDKRRYYLVNEDPDGQYALVKRLTTEGLVRALQDMKPIIDYTKINKAFEMIDENNNLFDNIILISPKTKGLKAAFSAGTSFDGYCIRDALKKACPDQDWSMLLSALGPKELLFIADSRNLKIQIFTPNFREEPLYEFAPGSTSYGGGKVVRLLYQNGHITYLSTKLQPPLRTATEEQIVWYQDESALFGGYREASPNTACSPLMSVSKRKTYLKGFLTPSEHHKIEFPSRELKPQAWSTAGVASLLFRDQFGHPIKERRFQELRQSGLVNRGMYLSRGYKGTVYGLDQQRAYASYKRCKYFSGFCDPNSGLEAFKYDPDTFQTILDNCEGLCLIHTTQEYPKCIFQSCVMWATFPMVRCAMDMKQPFNVLSIVAKSRTTEDLFTGVKTTLGEEDKDWFHSLIGKFQQHEVGETCVATSKDECKQLERKGFVAIGDVDVSLPLEAENKIFLMVAGEKQIDPSRPFQACYIHAYQKITMWIDVISRLEEFGISWKNDIKRIRVDGVWSSKLWPEELDLDPLIWRREKCRDGTPEENTELGIEHTKTDVLKTLSPIKYDPMFLSKYVALLGGPGTGKTYACEHTWGDKSTSNRVLLMTASTHTAVGTLTANSNKRGMTTQALLYMWRGTGMKTPEDGKKLCWAKFLSGVDRIIIDEFTMLSPRDCKDIISIGIPTLFCGDFLQLAAVEGSITPAFFEQNNFYVKELTENHRTTDKKTLACYDECRAAVRDNVSSKYAIEGCIASLKNSGVVSFIQYANIKYPKIWEREHLITSTNNRRIKINEQYVASLRGKKVPVQWGRRANEDKAMETVIKELQQLCENGEYLPDDDTIVDNKKVNVRVRYGGDAVVGMLMVVTKTTTKVHNQEIVYLSKILKESHNKNGVNIRRCVVRRITGKLAGTTATVGFACLEPAFAITYHKCQGATFSTRTTMDMHKLFKKEMCYVAISRMTDIRLLHVLEEPKPEPEHTKEQMAIYNATLDWLLEGYQKKN